MDAPSIRLIAALDEVAGDYDAVFCDVWGVLHNGLRKSEAAESALRSARRAGARVVLVTNSPRPEPGVSAQLAAMHVSPDAFDAIVTSGDATRDLIARHGGPVFFLGPERDLPLFDGLSAPLVGEDEASAVVVTGLLDDRTETPAGYADRLAAWAARGLPMICANPDIVVHVGDQLLWCAGALARDYAALGGEVRLAGKPHAPIYDLARRKAGLGPGARVLAIGDGMATDVKGAMGAGADVLFILAGIHEAEFTADDGAARVSAVLSREGLDARYFMAKLR